MQTDHILQLIKSLSAYEKNVLETQLTEQSKKKKPYYLALYRFYIKLLEKDLPDNLVEIELQKILKRKPKMQKLIANTRKQLKEKILWSLLTNFQKNDFEKEILGYIIIIRSLIDRKLHGEAQLLINSIKKKALLVDANKYLVELTDLELYLLNIQSGKKDRAIQSKLIEKINHYNLVFTVELTLKNIFCQLTLIIENDIELRKKESLEAFHAAFRQVDLKHLTIDDYVIAKNTRIIFWYYRIQNLYYRSLKQYKIAYENSYALINYFEGNSNLIKNFEAMYIKSLCSFTRVCKFNKNYVALENNLQKIKKLYETKISYNILETTCDIGVLYYLQTYQYQKSGALVEAMEEVWDTVVENSVDGKLLWYCRNNLLLYWVLNKNIKFESWLRKGLNISRPNKGKDFYFSIRMFKLMNFVDKNDFSTFYSDLEAFQKTLQNNKNYHLFEEIVISYFRKFYNIYNSNKTISLSKKDKETLKKQTFQALKNTLEQAKFKVSPINYDEIILWCESHIQNKTIKAIFEAT